MKLVSYVIIFLVILHLSTSKGSGRGLVRKIEKLIEKLKRNKGLFKEKNEVVELPDGIVKLVMELRVSNVTDGHVFILEGVATGPYFDIAYRADQSFSDSAVMMNIHLNFHHRLITISSCTLGVWEKENARNNPLKKYVPFKIIVIISEWCFRIIVNDNWTTCYDHRLAVENISYIKVYGSLIIHDKNIYSLGKEEQSSLALNFQ